jgi:hypothetical protein
MTWRQLQTWYWEARAEGRLVGAIRYQRGEYTWQVGQRAAGKCSTLREAQIRVEMEDRR